MRVGFSSSPFSPFLKEGILYANTTVKTISGPSHLSFQMKLFPSFANRVRLSHQI